MKQISMADILQLSVPERLKLIQDVWETIAAAPESLEITDAERAELDRRLEAYEANPTLGSPWPEVRARILARLKRER